MLHTCVNVCVIVNRLHGQSDGAQKRAVFCLDRTFMFWGKGTRFHSVDVLRKCTWRTARIAASCPVLAALFQLQRLRAVWPLLAGLGFHVLQLDVSPYPQWGSRIFRLVLTDA